MKALVFLAAATCTLLAATPPANADGLRCGHRLVSDGDSTYLVQARCGPPDDVNTWVEYRAVRIWVGNAWVDRTVEVKLERWIYDFGTDRLIRILVFEDGRLLKVDTGPHGEKSRTAS